MISYRIHMDAKEAIKDQFIKEYMRHALHLIKNLDKLSDNMHIIRITYWQKQTIQ